MRPKSEIYTPKRDDEHPRLFHMAVAPHRPAPLPYTASSLLFFFAKLLYAKPTHASGEAACREKRGRKHEKKK